MIRTNAGSSYFQLDIMIDEGSNKVDYSIARQDNSTLKNYSIRW